MVSVIIPARNEETDMAACVESIVGQDYPHDCIEVVVADGRSSDGTVAAAEKSLSDADVFRWLVVDSPRATIPANLNRGLQECRGEIVCRVDARCRIPPKYVSKCVQVLTGRPEVAVVGGTFVASVSEGASWIARGIARGMRNPITNGWSRHRRYAPSGPTDSVYLGAFRRADLEEERGWDERFLANQDYELNRRMACRGQVWFESDLIVAYRSRRTLASLGSHFRRLGRWKAAGWLERGVGIAPRQITLLITPLTLVMAGVWTVRRRPRVALLGGVALALMTDATVREPAGIAVRSASVVATATIASAWYVGVIEQGVMFLFGERLLTPRDGTR